LYAARQAGYGTPTSSSKSLGVIAGRIIHDDDVQDAIKEHAHRVMRAIPPEAIRALKELIRDPKHRDHARAIAMVIDRTDPLQTLTTVRIEDTRPPSIEATQAVLDRIEELMKRAGLAPPPKVIDGDFQVVERERRRHERDGGSNRVERGYERRASPRVAQFADRRRLADRPRCMRP
jgi:hypothetical protein